MEGLIFRLLIIILSGITLIALYGVLDVMFPERIARTQQLADQHPGRSFLIGLVNFLFFAAIALGFTVLGDRVGEIFFIPAVLVGTPIAIAVTFGIGGVIRLVGERMYAGQSGLRRSIYATGTLFLACLTPVIGWFGLSIYVGILGLGAFILSFFRKSEEEASAPLTETEEEDE